MKPLAGSQEAVTPTEQEADLARESSRELAEVLARSGAAGELHLRLRTGKAKEADIRLPQAAVRVLAGALQQMADGHGVLLLPVDAELTTQQAADLLRVSRPFLIKLLEQGKLPYRRVGAHRRLLARDVLRYGAAERARREGVLRGLAEETERLGLHE
jgi:excisionase family DNA binding protein